MLQVSTVGIIYVYYIIYSTRYYVRHRVTQPCSPPQCNGDRRVTQQTSFLSHLSETGYNRLFTFTTTYISRDSGLFDSLLCSPHQKNTTVTRPHGWNWRCSCRLPPLLSIGYLVAGFSSPLTYVSHPRAILMRSHIYIHSSCRRAEPPLLDRCRSLLASASVLSRSQVDPGIFLWWHWRNAPVVRMPSLYGLNHDGSLWTKSCFTVTDSKVERSPLEAGM